MMHWTREKVITALILISLLVYSVFLRENEFPYFGVFAWAIGSVLSFRILKSEPRSLFGIMAFAFFTLGMVLMIYIHATT